MKRSCSSENLENEEKKTKTSEESEGQPSSTSQVTSAVDSGGGDVSEEPKNLEEKKDPEVLSRSSDTPLSATTVSSPPAVSTPPTVSTPVPVDGETVPKTSETSQNKPETKNGEQVDVRDEDKPETGSEDQVEVKDDEKTEQSRWGRWQLVPTTVRQRMNYLLTTNELHDCTFLLGKDDLQQEFKLHSVILSMSSPEFEDMLNISKSHTISDIEPDIFKQILEYIYLDYVNLWSVEKTQALYRASVRFKLPHLCEKAVEYMMAKMSLDSIWPIFDAAICTQDQILTDECNKFFKKNINELLKHPKFTTVDHSVIANLVADDSLGVPEADLISGMLKWVHHQCLNNDLVPNLENKRSVLLPDTICKVRFLALSKEYFATNVAYSKSKGDESILTMEESYAILMNMVQLNSYPMPEGFSTITKQRTVIELTRLIRRVFNPMGTYQAITPSSPRLDKLTVLPGPSLTAPFGCKSFSLDLVVSKNITLFGIQVPTFFPGMIGPTPKLYEETYIVSIQNASKPNKPMIGSINWNGKVAYNSFVDLHFKDSIRLEKNHTYTIMVYTNNTYYLNQKLCTVEDAHGIKFTFKDSVSLFGKPGKQDFAFVSQILYSP